MSENIKNKTIGNLIWVFMEKSGSQVMQFVVSIILARLLTPEDYGLIGLISVFITISNVFIQSGWGQALVQKKDADNVDFSTVFYYSIVLSIIIYVVLFIAAPFIAQFYETPELTSIVRVLGLSLIIGAGNNVQHAYIQKTMQFKKFLIFSFGTISASSIIGICMAYAGFGVWALVAQQLFGQIFNVIIVWCVIEWRPILAFSWKRAGRLFSYGWKLLCSALIDTVYNNIYSLIIGKFYSQADLGYYNRGKSFPMMIVQNINAAISSVLFPVLSATQDDKVRVKAMTRRSLVTSTFLIFPAMAGLAAIAKPLTIFLLTEKWLPAVPFIQFCCFTYAFWTIHTTNLQAIQAMGRSDIFLKLETIKKIIGITVLIVTIPHGLYVMMIGRCFNTVLSSFINAYPNKKLLGYTYFEQVKDMLPSFLIAIFMFFVVLSVQLLNLPVIIIMIIQIIVGVVLYFGIAKLFKLECLEYIINTVKEIKKGNK